jgi:hypothetical protein
LAQHGWPGPPHDTQLVPIEQVVAVAVHAPPGQQLCETPPQVPQLPAAQAPPMLGHVVASGMHALFTQQPPPVHALPAQHGWPGPPQTAQVPPFWPEQTEPVSHWRPGQHARPGPPQVVQVLLRHAAPTAVQVLLPQHVSPSPPHGAHWPATQALPAAVQLEPGQHASPRPPQVPQLPAVQVPRPAPHDAPAPRHWPPTQQPPALQALPAQHASPAPPHVAVPPPVPPVPPPVVPPPPPTTSPASAPASGSTAAVLLQAHAEMNAHDARTRTNLMGGLQGGETERPPRRLRAVVGEHITGSRVE